MCVYVRGVQKKHIASEYPHTQPHAHTQQWYLKQQDHHSVGTTAQHTHSKHNNANTTHTHTHTHSNTRTQQKHGKKQTFPFSEPSRSTAAECNTTPVECCITECVNNYTDTFTHTHTHTHTPTHGRGHPNTHTHTWTHTHTHTHEPNTHIHTRKETHTLKENKL